MSSAIALQAGPPPPHVAAYTPKGGALALFYCHTDEALIEGPANTGKSRAALEKLYFCCSKYPGIRCLIIRKTRESCTESVLVTWESKVVPDGSPLLVGADRNHRQRYTFPNGSEIVVGGLDKPSKIMSTEYDLIYVAEATELSEADWEALTTRTRNKRMPYNQVLADCNPAAPTHWLNQRCTAGRTQRIYSRHEDNPTVTEDDLRKLRNLTGARRARLYEGRWAAQEGLVYQFDPLIHMVDKSVVQPAWPRYRVIDFGYTNPFVCQWWATDPDGRLYLYRELYQTGRLVQDLWADITRHSAGETYVATLADHDAEDRATLHYFGIYTLPAHKEVSPGIQAVQARLALAGDKKPRLFLCHDALIARDPVLVDKKRPTCTREEFDGYVWPKSQDGKELKEAPVKVDDHGMDTTRYMVAHLDIGQSPGVFL
jgi:PBSX family phage terminase large subunit